MADRDLFIGMDCGKEQSNYFRAPINPPGWLRRSIIQNYLRSEFNREEMAQRARASLDELLSFENGGDAPKFWMLLLNKMPLRIGIPGFPNTGYGGLPKRGILLGGEQFHWIIRSIREEYKLSASEMASACNVSPRRYREFEKGKDMTFEETERVMGYLGFTAL